MKGNTKNKDKQGVINKMIKPSDSQWHVARLHQSFPTTSTKVLRASRLLSNQYKMGWMVFLSPAKPGLSYDMFFSE